MDGALRALKRLQAEEQRLQTCADRRAQAGLNPLQRPRTTLGRGMNVRAGIAGARCQLSSLPHEKRSQWKFNSEDGAWGGPSHAPTGRPPLQKTGGRR